MKAGVHSHIQPYRVQGQIVLPCEYHIRNTDPILSCDDPFPASLVEPPPDMPVPHDPRGILTGDTPEDGEEEGGDQRKSLLARSHSSITAYVEGADGVCGCDSTGESEFELEDVEATERHRKEYPDVCTA